jgi:uncharacterized protein YbaR (Trm112 family)
MKNVFICPLCHQTLKYVRPKNGAPQIKLFVCGCKSNTDHTWERDIDGKWWRWNSISNCFMWRGESSEPKEQKAFIFR